jgi:hypothetical protein
MFGTTSEYIGLSPRHWRLFLGEWCHTSCLTTEIKKISRAYITLNVQAKLMELSQNWKSHPPSPSSTPGRELIHFIWLDFTFYNIQYRYSSASVSLSYHCQLLRTFFILLQQPIFLTKQSYNLDKWTVTLSKLSAQSAETIQFHTFHSSAPNRERIYFHIALIRTSCIERTHFHTPLICSIWEKRTFTMQSSVLHIEKETTSTLHSSAPYRERNHFHFAIICSIL